MKDKIKRAKKIEQDKQKDRQSYSTRKDEKRKNRRGGLSKVKPR